MIKQQSMAFLFCKAKRQYLLTCKVSRYCHLALQGRVVACNIIDRVIKYKRCSSITRNRNIYYVSKEYGYRSNAINLFLYFSIPHSTVECGIEKYSCCTPVGCSLWDVHMYQLVSCIIGLCYKMGEKLPISFIICEIWKKRHMSI